MQCFKQHPLILFLQRNVTMVNLLRYPTFLLLLSLSACITINVYFPAAAAQKAADKIIDKVYGTDPPPEKPEPSSSRSPEFFFAIAQWIIPPAYAQEEANIEISSPTIEVLSDQMAKRHQQLLPHYEQGAIGLTQQASILLREPNKVPLKLRNGIKKLIAEENHDRSELYREIALANGHPEWESKIQAVFAKRWIERASPGWWYQEDNGQWRQR